MLCRNCNHILTGNENFCPNCGAPPLPPEAKKEVPKEKLTTYDPQNIFENEKPPVEKPEPEKERVTKPPRQSSVFTLESIDDDRDDLACKPRKKAQKNGGAKILLLIFTLCIISAAAFLFADYFQLTPAISSFFKQSALHSDGNVSSDAQTFNRASGIVDPEINYAMSTAFVSPLKGLAMRKGPADSYAPVCILPNSAQVQIFGGSLTQENWVYVYCPLKECYGWINSSFLQTGNLE